jgi:hypothetical protein
MALKFFVPKFITIEDRLAGLFTFKQLFALLGAFLLSYFTFKINPIFGLIVGAISFGSAGVLTFLYINGKPFMYILPQFFDFLFGNRKFVWQKIEKMNYKEIQVPTIPEIPEETTLPTLKPKKQSPSTKAEIILEYPETSIKEKVTLSLQEPIANQTQEINTLVHRHLINPKNPYRFFPYIKFYKNLKNG